MMSEREKRLLVAEGLSEAEWASLADATIARMGAAENLTLCRNVDGTADIFGDFTIGTEHVARVLITRLPARR